MRGRAAQGVRSRDQLAAMRRAGRVVAEMHDRIRAAIAPGVTTAELDRIGREVLDRRCATSSFLGYHGFPAVICASPSEVVVHGIPGPRRLEEGEIVTIDCGAIVDGWHGDAAFTTGVGRIDPGAERLIEVAWASLEAGLAAMVPGGRVSDAGAAIQAVVEAAGYHVAADYAGHGIGQEMHEPPDVPNCGPAGRGRRLLAGQTYAVEPILCEGTPRTEVLGDGWTVVTADGSRSAHVEHTVVVADDGPEVLTRL